jgi:hypothetical protein
MALNYFNRRELKTPTATRSRELPLPIRADRRDGRDPGVWSECRKRPRGRNGHAWRRPTRRGRLMSLGDLSALRVRAELDERDVSWETTSRSAPLPFPAVVHRQDR